MSEYHSSNTLLWRVRIGNLLGTTTQHKPYFRRRDCIVRHTSTIDFAEISYAFYYISMTSYGSLDIKPHIHPLNGSFRILCEIKHLRVHSVLFPKRKCYTERQEEGI